MFKILLGVIIYMERIYDRTYFRDIATGFHRLNNVPLDDSIKLFKVKDLYDYINNGSVYEGQIIILELINCTILVEIKKYFDEVSQTYKYAPVIINWPSNIEMNIKSIDGKNYIMVYYYYHGRIFEDKNSSFRTYDSKAWSLLPYIGILAGKQDNIQYFISKDNSQYISFIQDDLNEYSYNTETNINIITDGFNGLYNYSNGNFIFSSGDISIGILAKNQNTSLISLYVEADQYLKLIGVDYNEHI